MKVIPDDAATEFVFAGAAGLGAPAALAAWMA